MHCHCWCGDKLSKTCAMINGRSVGCTARKVGLCPWLALSLKVHSQRLRFMLLML